MRRCGNLQSTTSIQPSRDKTASKHGARPDYRELGSVQEVYRSTLLTGYARFQTTNKLQDVFSEIGGDLDLPMVSLAGWPGRATQAVAKDL